MNNQDELNQNNAANAPEIPAPNVTPSQPTDITTPVEATPTPPTQKSRKKPILLITLAVLLVAAGAFAVYLLYFQSKDTDITPQSTKEKSSQQVQNNLTAQEVVAKVHEAINDELRDSYPSLTTADITYAPPYKPADFKVHINDRDMGHGLAITPLPTTPSADASIKAINTTVTLLNKTLTTITNFTKTIKKDVAFYQNDKTLCSLSLAGMPIDLRCANISDYAQVIGELKPFVEAYLASPDGQQASEDTVIDGLAIYPGKDGYNRAEVNVHDIGGAGGFVGLFYGKDDKWTYWKGTQQVVNCTEYNTAELQKTFEGYRCHNATTGGFDTVKVTL